MNKKVEAVLIYFIVYISASITAFISLKHLFTKPDETILNLFKADLIGSIAVYLNCILFNSFSLYDPYWTVQATLISVYFIKTFNYNIDTRSWIVIVLVNVWALRLTFNLFITSVDDITHEDWRYSSFRKKWSPKPVYFLVGFLAFILMPTVIVFFGCLPIYFVLESKQKAINLFDLIAIVITVLAICFEAVGDYQLRKFTLSNKNSKSVCSEGLWSLCRHPNYFGEIFFWFGLFIFALAAKSNDFAKLTEDKLFIGTFLLGPFAVFVLIYFGSLPLMEERQTKRRGESYKSYMRRVPFKILPLAFLVGNGKHNISAKDKRK
jgi:steroid 5-alpha reductase family enzyme